MFKNVSLEMSLKPFKRLDEVYIENVCKKIFHQWSNLIHHADMVSVLLWSSDGSEILDYEGDLNEELEWAKYIGGANPRREWDRNADPEGLGLHTRYYLYMDRPPIFTYGLLKTVIETIKRIGNEFTMGKPVRVGVAFDPGPEFAKSDFKYNRHNEICMGDSMGKKSMVCCYGVLHEDQYHYAGFPGGIPEGTPFGLFFGRQCNHFLNDLGFDYLWLSNGFGFGTETWGTTGAIFDGEKFHAEKFEGVKENILNFWRLFRKECPEIPVETRGTNLSTGIDLATDGVPLKDIYEGDFHILPPPNSPWAALDGDFGLELSGYMSRIAEVSADEYLFRFYVHDPWWMNSPWIDRYEGQPHDIYLPMAIARIDGAGEVKNFTHLNILTIDNSLGEMPEKCPNEVIPHILNAKEHMPDEASPVVWVYPFREYHQMGEKGETAIREAFFGDWFIRGAINNGLPLSTVVSTDNFISSIETKPHLYKGSVLVSTIPQEGSEYETAIIEFIKSGGKVIFYGPLDHASPEMLDLLNLSLDTAISGNLSLTIHDPVDELLKEDTPKVIHHGEFISVGGINTVIKKPDALKTKVLASVSSLTENIERIAALYRNIDEWNDGAVVWVRGTCSNTYQKGVRLLQPDNPKEYFIGEVLMRYVLNKFGYTISFVKEDVSVKSPVIMINRNNNAFYFSGYVPDTTTSIKLRFPMGAPLLMGYETRIKDGESLYHLPRAWHIECRVFVEQEYPGTVQYKEIPPVSYQMRRRIQVNGLKNATLRVFPEMDCQKNVEVLLNTQYPYFVGESYDGEWMETSWGRMLEIRNVTGSVMISMPFNR